MLGVQNAVHRTNMNPVFNLYIHELLFVIPVAW
jgi:hypothetical protein